MFSVLDTNIFCKGLDAYLAEVLNDETQTLLETQMKLLPPSNWWLGASDEENVSTIITYVLDFGKLGKKVINQEINTLFTEFAAFFFASKLIK